VVTPKQKQILDFLRTHIKKRGFAPTLEEICAHMGLGSVATVHKHLARLEAKGLIRRLPHQSRALEVVERQAAGRTVRVPLLGRVAAGAPIEAIEDDDSVLLPEDMLGRRETFTLRVAGDSMIGEGILDGDLVVVESRPDAPDGATVVALVDGEATVKTLQRKRGKVHLVPANPRYQPIVARPESVEIRGVVIGLLRHYR